MHSRSLRTSLVAIAIVVLSVGCSHDTTGPDESIASIPTVISAVRTAPGVNATLRRGARPSPGSGPTIHTSPTLTMVNGGTNEVKVTSQERFSSLVIAVDGLDGYYQLSLPASTDSTSLLITFPQTLERGSLPIIVMANDGHAWGGEARVSASMIQVGSGDIQVSLSWDKAADLDLHVVEPSGEEVYYADRHSSTGGRLDLDSNASCNIDHRNNENITWAEGSAPRGEYRVLVDNWSSCDKTPISFVVTVTVKGRDPQVFTGQFADPGDRGIGGSGRLVATFTY